MLPKPWLIAMLVLPLLLPAQERSDFQQILQRLDQLERQIMQLEIEQSALKKEKDEGSRERLKRIEKDLANLKEKSNQLKTQWQNEKAAINAVSVVNSQIEQMQNERAVEEELTRHLRLEIETLKSPSRVEALATGPLHLVAPSRDEAIVIERVVPADPPAKSVVARAQ